MEKPEVSVESKRVDIEVDGYESVGIRYLTAGEKNEGPPVVLLHGIGLDAASVSWKYALPHFADEHRVIALDFPGHGESDESELYTTEYYINVLGGLLDVLDIDTVCLAGISMGGAVALGHTLDNQQMVERLVLVDSYGLGRDAPWRPGGSALVRMPGFDGLLGAGFALNPAIVAGSLAGVVVNTPAGFVTDVYRAVGPAAARALSQWQRDEFRACGLRTCYLDRLSELRTPTLLIHGREDPIFPIGWSERATERIRENAFEVFENCGHWPPREYPEKFNRVVSGFL
ncbi:MAG TPA: alpha/beta hydrolase [Halococcus sp.]|nr:alpha/beta hydrolase [Halococcus sp.]